MTNKISNLKSKTCKIRKLLFLLFFISIIIPTLVFAAEDTAPTTGTSKVEDVIPRLGEGEGTPSSTVNTGVGVPTGIDEDGNVTTKSSYTSFMDYMSTIFSFALKLGAALTALMVMYAGFKYMTSQGNPSTTGEAKEIIIGSLSGFAMLLLIYLLLNVLGFPAPS